MEKPTLSTEEKTQLPKQLCSESAEADSAAKRQAEAPPHQTNEVEDKSLWQHFKAAVTKNYFNFSGRATRKELWGVGLCWQLIILGIMALMILKFYLEGNALASGSINAKTDILLGISFLAIFFVGTIIPMIAVQVRRLHDLSQSGWWLLPILLLSGLYIGLIGTIFMLFIKGKDETNQFGKSPYPKKTANFPIDVLIITANIILPVIVLFCVIFLLNKNTSATETSSVRQTSALNTTSPPKMEHGATPQQTTSQPPIQSEQLSLPAVTNLSTVNSADPRTAGEDPVVSHSFLRKESFRSLPVGTSLTLLEDVHIRQCASSKCSSIGVLPRGSSALVARDDNNLSYHNGWIFILYQGYFCFPQNYSVQTACRSWDSNIQAMGWVYSNNLALP